MKQPGKKYNDEDNMLVNDLRSIVSKARSKAYTADNYSLVEQKWKIECSGEAYTISGNKLTTYEEDGTNVLDVYTIQSISSTTMVLKYNLDGNASYPSTITFKKIK